MKQFHRRLPLVIGAFIIWMVVGIVLGVIAALKRGKWQDRLAMGFALIGYSFPSFFIGLRVAVLRRVSFRAVAVPSI